MKTDTLLNDIFTALRINNISCVIDKHDIIENTFNSRVAIVFSSFNDTLVYFKMPKSLSFTVCNNTDKTYIDVNLASETLLLDEYDNIYNTIVEYSQKWHNFHNVYVKHFKSRIQSINDYVSIKEVTVKILEYLQANKKILKQEYNMLQSIYSL